MVSGILALSGYTANQALHRMRLLEPTFSGGINTALIAAIGELES